MINEILFLLIKDFNYLLNYFLIFRWNFFWFDFDINFDSSLFIIDWWDG